MSAERKKIFTQNLIYGSGLKFANLLLGFALVPVMLEFLGQFNYGLWVTLFSIVNWLNVLDLGVGNGLRYRITKYFTLGQTTNAQNEIAYAYLAFLILGSVTYAIIFALLSHIDLSRLLDIGSVESNEFQTVTKITLLFFVTNFVLSIYKSLYFADHKAFVVELSVFLVQASNIVLLILANRYLENSLLVVSIITGGTQFVVSIILTVLFFLRHKELLINLAPLRLRSSNGLMVSSGKFLIIQISILVILSTDNFLISLYQGSESVTSYAIATKYFMAYVSIWYVILGPMAALVADAYYTNDFVWLRRSLRRMVIASLFLAVGIALGVYCFDDILNFWIGQELRIPRHLALAFGVTISLRIFTEIYSTYLNALGVVNLQVILLLVGAISNIPISIYFMNEVFNSSVGVIIGTLISYLPLAILLPYQLSRIIATGSEK